MCSSNSLCTLSIICTIGRRRNILRGEICVFHVVSFAVWGVMWLMYLSPTDGQDLFGPLGYPLLPCHCMCCAYLVEERDVQNHTAPQEHDWETLASRFPVLSTGISSLRKTQKRMVAYKWVLKSVIFYCCCCLFSESYALLTFSSSN